MKTVVEKFKCWHRQSHSNTEITIEQLKKPHSSIRRNPLIAEAFFRAGHIEQFGSGTLRMIKQLQETGNPEPTFTEEGNGFIVRFDKALEPVDFDPFELNIRQLKVVKMAELEEIQASDVQEEFPEVARKTITRDLTELVKKNILNKTGKGKGTRYRLRFKQ